VRVRLSRDHGAWLLFPRINGCLYPSTIRRSDSLGSDRGAGAAVTLANGPSPIVKIRPSNQLAALILGTKGTLGQERYWLDVKPTQRPQKITPIHSSKETPPAIRAAVGGGMARSQSDTRR